MNRSIIVAVSASLLTLVAAKRYGSTPAAQPSPAARPAPVARRTPTSNPSSALTKATTELEQVEKRLRTAYEQTDDFQKADAAVKEAQANYDAAVKAAVEKVKDQPEFAAALENQRKVEDEQFAVRSNPGAKVDPELATRVMDARTAVRKLEIQAGDADPAAKEAKAKVLAAKEALNAVRAKLDTAMRSDPDYIAARKAVDDARAQSHHG